MPTKYIDTTNLTTNQGFRVSYPSNIQGFGDLSSLGDINGDGYDDIIIGDPKQAVSESDTMSTSYVIFGNIKGYSNLYLSNSSGYHGFKITSDRDTRPEKEDDDWYYGPGTIYLGGHSVSGAGDVNGDGYDDIVIGARYVENKTGVCYVIFGHPNIFSNIHLNNISSSQGFSIFGKNIDDFTCDTVSKAGDVNADGYKDIIIGAPSFYLSKNNHNGTSYVIFGKASHSNIYLSNLTLEQGFYISGTKDSYNGYAVSGAGDLNGDGYDEVITVTIGPDENIQHSYVIFGKATGHTNIYLPELYSSQGFKITGAKESSVSELGDVNGDGLDDMLISSPSSSYPERESYSGISYVIFGKKSEFSDIDLNSFSSVQGFKIYGKGSFDQIGESLDGVGDFNGDGVNDILLGSSNDDEGAYLIFGRYNGIKDIYLNNLTSSQGLFIAANGEARRVSEAGDINGDGYSDILIGYVYEDYSYSGYKLTQTNYLIYGASNGFTPVPTMLQTFSPTENYSSSPSLEPSLIPTDTPTNNPTAFPSMNPTKIPSFSPSLSPSRAPTAHPTLIPTLLSTTHKLPSIAPTMLTNEPTLSISSFPSIIQTNQPSSLINSYAPSSSDLTTILPTNQPSVSENLEPTIIQIDLSLMSVNQGKIVKNPTPHKIIDLASVGDFNGDGYNDFVVIATAQGRNTVRVVFGGELNLNNLEIEIYSAAGLTISVPETSVTRVNSAGDFNKDGYSDLILSNSYYTVDGKYAAGVSYIIFGKNDGIDINTQNMSPSTGFKILGTAWEEYSGSEISEAGDFNGDGYSDIIISTTGTSYVILGKSSGFSDISLSTLQSNQGFKINYAGGNAAGDFNGDGYDDIIIGAHTYSGTSFLIFGKANNFVDINVWQLEINQGFKIIGFSNSETGSKASKAGDLNGDGYGDIIIGDADDRPSSYGHPGTSYIVFGKQGENFNDLVLSSISSTDVFKVVGYSIDSSGSSVNNAGDFNGDGYHDIIIGAPGGGRAYIIFGKPTNFNNINVWDLNKDQGIIIQGTNYMGNKVIGVGDFSGDGLDDVIVSSVNNIDVHTYLIYGSNSETTTSPTYIPTQLPTIIPSTEPPSINPISFPSSLPSSYPTNRPSTAPKLVSISDKIYAIFAREVYANPNHAQLLTEVNENGSRLPSGWSVLIDSESAGIVSDTSIAWGFFAKAYKNDISDNIIVAFQGTDDLYDLFSADKDLALGKVPSHYSPAKEFVDYIIDYYQLNPSLISFTGHSLGGFLAQLMSATYNKLSVIFDSPGAGKVINTYYQDSSYSIEYSISEISNKVKCFNSAPNLINIASGAHFGNVFRVFPKYDFYASTYTIQQHDMSNILLQFKTTSGDAKTSSAMEGYWRISDADYNWPFFEATGVHNLLRLNGYLNDIYFKNYNQNPYFWEASWDNGPNNYVTLFCPTSLRETLIKNYLESNIDNQYLSSVGLNINGDDSGNKFFGGTNYADIMNGGTGNDEYYPFSGMDNIKDLGGVNNYYFYTHNMKGTTKIIDQDKTGKVNFVNIGCSIGKVYKIDEVTNNAFAFFPIFDSSCDLKKYSSGALESIFSPNAINHKNDVVLMKYSAKDLLISYNNNDFSDPTRNKISIANFNEGDFSIFINNNAENQNTYIAVGGDEDEKFICSASQDSILAGLGGVNTYFIPLFPNKFSCSIISNDESSNVYKFTLENDSKRSSAEESRALLSSGSIDIFGMKAIDIIDVSSFKLKDFSALSYQYSVNGTNLNLPGGLSINLYQTSIFLLTIDGDSFAFYNSSAHNYTTNIAGLGINMTELLNAYESTPDNYYIDNPTYFPTISPESSNEEKVLTVGEIAGIAIGSLALMGLSGYALYAYNYNIWPFAADLAKIAHSGIIEEV